MRRIAVLTTRFPSNSQTFVARQIVDLLARGVDVRIIPIYPLLGDEPTSMGTPGGLEARICEQPASELSTVRRLRSLLQAALTVLRHRPSSLLTLLRGKKLGSFADRRQALRIAAVLAVHGPFDVIHCHFGTVGLVGARARHLVSPRSALSIVFHGFDISRSDAIDAQQYRWLFAEADLLLPVSQRWQDALRQLGAPADKTLVHRVGVDVAVDADDENPEAQDFEPTEHPRGEALRLVSICRLVEKKGIDDALHAIARCKEQDVPIRYVIVGDGPLAASLRRTASDLDVEELVEFAGWQAPAAAMRHLAASDVLLAPSVTAADGDQEGIPVAIMEAMSAGLPVVSTWHSGIPELVVNGETGFLAPERDPGQLAAHLLDLQDPGLRSRLGNAGRVRVRELHDRERLADDLLMLFDHIAPPAAT